VNAAIVRNVESALQLLLQMTLQMSIMNREAASCKNTTTMPDGLARIENQINQEMSIPPDILEAR
jgi:hypothetical protein